MTIKNLHFSMWWGNKTRLVIEDSDGIYHGAITIGDTINGSPIVAFEIVSNANMMYRTANGNAYDWNDETITIKRLS